MKLWKWLSTIGFFALLLGGGERLASLKSKARTYQDQAEEHARRATLYHKLAASQSNPANPNPFTKFATYEEHAAKQFRFAAAHPWGPPPRIGTSPVTSKLLKDLNDQVKELLRISEHHRSSFEAERKALRERIPAFPRFPVAPSPSHEQELRKLKNPILVDSNHLIRVPARLRGEIGGS